MEQLRIMMYDRESFVFAEYDVLIPLELIISDYCNDAHYLKIAQENGREFVINKDYILALQIEEED